MPGTKRIRQDVKTSRLKMQEKKNQAGGGPAQQRANHAFERFIIPDWQASQL